MQIFVASLRIGDEADLAHACALRGRHGLGHALVAHALVAADVQVGLRVLGGLGLQARLQLLVADVRLVPVVLAVGRDAQADGFGLDVLALGGGARQVHRHRMLHDRHGDDEDDEQHQHDVHQGRHVDLVHHLVGVVLGSECHGASAFLDGQDLALVGRGADAGSGHEVGMQVVREAVEAVQDGLVAPHQRVVAQHRGNGHGQAQRGHDERFADRAGHLVDGGLARGADRHEGVVDAPDGAEEADERRGGTDRRQDGEARLQAGGEFVDAVAQATRDPVADVQAVVQVRLGVAVVGRGLAAFEREVAERIVGIAAQLFHAGGEILAVPEVACGAGVFLELDDVQRLDEDDDPRGERHAEQQHGDGPGDEITLDPDVGNAEMRFHENS